MKQLVLNFQTFGLAVATRAALGAGVGMLLADRIPRDRRRAIGLALIGIGAATTIPVVRAVRRGAIGAR